MNRKMSNQTNRIEVHVEKHDDGTYWGTTQNVPGLVSAYGNSMEELKKNLLAAFKDYIEVAELENEDWVNEIKDIKTFTYQVDVQSFFRLIPEVKISALAKKARINESLMRQYATGKANASEERMKEIEKAVHELGKELLSISF